MFTVDRQDAVSDKQTGDRQPAIGNRQQANNKTHEPTNGCV